MCVPIWKRSARERVWLGIANLCLFCGLAAGVVFHPASTLAKDWLDGVRGLLLGVSIGMNLFVLKFGAHNHRGCASGS